MQDALDLDGPLMVALTTWSAQHNKSVPRVIREAILAYLADVDSGLIRTSPDWPRKVGRPRIRSPMRRSNHTTGGRLYTWKGHLVGRALSLVERIGRRRA